VITQPERETTVIKGSFTARPQTFASAAGWAAKFVTAKPVVPVHGGILLDVADGTLTVAAYNENASARATLTVDGDGAGRAVVSGRLLAELVGTFPDKPITVAGEEDDLVLSAGRFHVTLPTMDEAEYPALPAAAAVIGSVSGDALADAVARVVVAANKDLTTQINLAGVHLTFAGQTIRVLATDSRRAASVTLPWTGSGEGTALVLGQILADAAAAFAGPDDITVGLDGSVLSFTSPTRSMTVRTLGEQYNAEAFAKFLAERHPQTVRVSVAELTRPLKRAALVRAKDGPITLTLTIGLITLQAKADEIKQDSGEEIDAEYDGPDHQLAFNPKYLGDVLGTVPGDVLEMSFNPGRFSSVVCTTPGNDAWAHVLVPIKLTR
jgi:DNA polymerase-3 subunit beta